MSATRTGQFRLVAYNARGQMLRLWADVEMLEMVENLTVTEAYALMDAHSSGFRYEISGGYLVTGRAILNRIHHFRLLHPNGHAEVINRRPTRARRRPEQG